MRTISIALLTLATATSAYAIGRPLPEPDMLGLLGITAVALFLAGRKK